MPIAFYPLTSVDVLEAALAVSAFVMLLVLGSLVLPGSMRPGPERENGKRQRYKLNGLLLFALVIGGALGGQWSGDLSLAEIALRLPSLALAANALAFSVSLALFLRGRRRGGRGIGAFFYGAELDPAWLGLDLKIFSYRPSLIGLGLINLSLAALEVQRYGRMSVRMLVYQTFYLLYVANYFQFEHGMLFTWDVLAERFGWMLVWGDYVLVPFFYSIPGWYLLDNRAPLAPAALAGILTLYIAGFCLFRGANQQKHRFKQNPNARIWGGPARSLDGRLLISGFWGIGRKLNYTGELAMYWAWTLLCGFHSAIPYLLPLWLTGFLLHRARRDEKRCRAKYGALWDAYCARARFRMIPFLY